MSCIDPTLNGHVGFYSELPENLQGPPKFIDVVCLGSLGQQNVIQG